MVWPWERAGPDMFRNCFGMWNEAVGWRGHWGLRNEYRYDSWSLICKLWMLSICLICFMYIVELISFDVLFMDLFNWLNYIYIAQQQNSVKQCSGADLFYMQGSHNSAVVSTFFFGTRPSNVVVSGEAPGPEARWLCSLAVRFLQLYSMTNCVRCRRSVLKSCLWCGD